MGHQVAKSWPTLVLSVFKVLVSFVSQEYRMALSRDSRYGIDRL